MGQPDETYPEAPAQAAPNPVGPAIRSLLTPLVSIEGRGRETKGKTLHKNLEGQIQEAAEKKATLSLVVCSKIASRRGEYHPIF